MVIVDAVMPGADAVSGAAALLLLPPLPVLGVELELGPPLEPEEQAATASAAAAMTAIAGARSRFDLFIECLSFIGSPGSSPRGWQGVVAGRPSYRRPEIGRRGPRPGAQCGRRGFRTGRASSASRPGYPAGTGA